MSFLVLPVREKYTSMVSPGTERTTPGPNVLCDTRSPAANVSWAFAASRLTGCAWREEPAPPLTAEPRDAAPLELRALEGLPGQLGASLGREPPVERVREPKTLPP